MLPIFAKERNNIMDAIMVLLGMAIAVFGSFFVGITSLKKKKMTMKILRYQKIIHQMHIT